VVNAMNLIIKSYVGKKKYNLFLLHMIIALILGTLTLPLQKISALADSNTHTSLKIVDIAFGDEAVFALKEDGQILIQGKTWDFLFGDFYKAEEWTQARGIGALENIKQISGQRGSVFALDGDGEVYSIGSVYQSVTSGVKELVGGYPMTLLEKNGTISIVSLKNTAIRIKGLNNIVKISTVSMYRDSLALDTNGVLWKFKIDSEAYLDENTSEIMVKPELVDIQGVTDFFVGQDYSLVKKKDGTIWFWGTISRPYSEQVMTDWTQQWSSLKPIKIMDGVKSMFATNTNTFLLKEDGTLWGWGLRYEYGQLGNQTAFVYKSNTNTSSKQNIYEMKPMLVQVSSNKRPLKVIDYYGKSIMALMDDNSVWTWGEDYFITSNKLQLHSVPTKVDFTQIDEVKVVLNGTTLNFKEFPYVDHGNTMVPMRPIFESLGAEIKFDSRTKTISASKLSEGIHIWMQVNNPVIKIGEESLKLSIAPKFKNGTTMVPLRVISESFGAKVVWDEKTKTVLISMRLQ
jgi:alpha-tubulin suppressor-like RCC1 family protein